MTNTPRQRYGLGSFIKKIGRGAKKVLGSKLGKAALLGGGLWGLGKMGGIPGSGIGKNWWSKGMGLGKNLLLGKGTGQMAAGQTGARSGGLWNWVKNNKGQAALLGLGTAGVVAPFLGGDEDDEETIQDWTIPSAAIGGLWDRTKDYYKTGPAGSNLAFMPKKEFVDPLMYAAQGGIAQLANGGNPAEAQAEQMLKMEYQKYRNQGGTMSYQQFKMAVLQQAQGQGPMAQGQGGGRPSGDRPMFQGGELVEDASMIEETPEGMMEENVEEVQGEPTREQMEALAMEIFQLRLEELDEEQLMVVYQAAMEQQPREEEVQEEIAFNPQMEAPQMAAHGGRIGFFQGALADTQGSAGGQAMSPGTSTTGGSRFIGGGGQGGSGVNNTGGNVPIVNPVSPNYPAVGPVFNNELVRRQVALQRFEKQFEEDEKNKAAAAVMPTSGYEVLGGELGKQRVNEKAAADIWKEYNTGGRIRRAEGGIMDLGGMEKDYRAEGGFVPLGGEERADDVPARLSKNEFVFTADAVRSAGGGDIDQGAEVMQNMMENLEQGGEISEESQGAQGMYNNMKQLETRVE